MDGKDDLILTGLDKLDEPDSLIALRKEVQRRLPRAELPEILLEIAARTGFSNEFTHISERDSRASELVTSIHVLLLGSSSERPPETRCVCHHERPVRRSEDRFVGGRGLGRDETVHMQKSWTASFS